MIVRPAQAGDVATLHALLVELAAFEGGAVTASPADLARDGFGATPLFEALLAEQHGEALGVLVFIPTYSSWRGRPGLMIHDLYVRATARGHGVATALVAEVKRLAHQRGCGRVEVNVLDWNTRARAFYERLGLSRTEGWLGYRAEL